MWGTIIAWVGRTLIGKATIAIAMAVTLGLAGLGGYKIASGACEKEKRIALENLIKQMEIINKQNQEINEEVEDALVEIRYKERIVIQEVIKYVQDNPTLTACELDSHGLYLWNSTDKTKLPE